MGIVNGNSKLGKGLWHFSIPARKSICVGESSLCSEECYGKHGLFLMPSTQKSLEDNYQRTLQSGFVQSMVEDIHKVVAAYFRIHANGEFYAAKYVRDWVNIVRRSPRTMFFGYTRSWRQEEFRPALTALAAKPNMRLWLSCDKETGPPAAIPHTRRAYMQVNRDDLPRFPVDLVFRVKTKPVAKKVAGITVCPVENGVTKTTCAKCRLCFDRHFFLDDLNDYQAIDWKQPHPVLA